jgi:hypothetical protein
MMRIIEGEKLQVSDCSIPAACVPARRKGFFGLGFLILIACVCHLRGRYYKPKDQYLRRKLVLHIGPHKTASSHIQIRMCQDIDKLARMGVIVPMHIGRPVCEPKYYAGAAFELGKHVHNEFYREGQHPWTDLQNSLVITCKRSPESSVFLSAEDFSRLNLTHVEELAKGLRNTFDDVQVVLFYRPKLEHILSLYTQMNKAAAQPMTLSQFVFGFLTNKPDHTHAFPTSCLQYQSLISHYGRVFGMQNVHIVSYAGVQAVSKDPWDVITQDLLGLTHIDPRGESESVNASPDYFDLTAYAALRHLVISWMTLYAPPHVNASKFDDVVACGARYLQREWGSSIPKTCTNMESVVASWEEDEQEFLESVQSRVQFHYFQRNENGTIIWSNMTRVVQACDVDFDGILTQSTIGSNLTDGIINACFNGIPRRPA